MFLLVSCCLPAAQTQGSSTKSEGKGADCTGPVCGWQAGLPTLLSIEVPQPALNAAQRGSTDCKSARRSRRKDGAVKLKDPSSRTGLSCSKCIAPKKCRQVNETSATRSHIEAVGHEVSQAIAANPHWSRKYKKWELNDSVDVAGRESSDYF